MQTIRAREAQRAVLTQEVTHTKSEKSSHCHSTCAEPTKYSSHRSSVPMPMTSEKSSESSPRAFARSVVMVQLSMPSFFRGIWHAFRRRSMVERSSYTPGQCADSPKSSLIKNRDVSLGKMGMAVSAPPFLPFPRDVTFLGFGVSSFRRPIVSCPVASIVVAFTSRSRT
ncbi:hypothetical protein BC826DRAFT_1024739 [Russula brevipes]|nr:hypothetical protein BC826DRAFT_1024739 [Russula brevipes]